MLEELDLRAERTLNWRASSAVVTRRDASQQVVTGGPESRVNDDNVMADKADKEIKLVAVEVVVETQPQTAEKNL